MINKKCIVLLFGVKEKHGKTLFSWGHRGQVLVILAMWVGSTAMYTKHIPSHTADMVPRGNHHLAAFPVKGPAGRRAEVRWGVGSR